MKDISKKKVENSYIRLITIFVCLIFIGLNNFAFSIDSTFERLERALVALPQDGGKVFLSWRFFKTENPDTIFNVYRREEDTDYQQIGQALDSSNYLDETSAIGKTYYYIVKPSINNHEGLSSNEASVITQETERGYITLPFSFSGEGAIGNVVAGDLDGDGLFDYVFQAPQHVEDPGTYHLEAYLFSGEHIWDFDLGIGNYSEDGNGCWSNSYTVWDLDGDKKAEVIARVRQDNSYYLAIIDGLTGEVKNKVPWPSVYDRTNDRHVLVIAYLDGVNPYIILQVGTYYQVKLQAYDRNLNNVWAKQNLGDGSSGHGVVIIDCDQDGNDEILQGDNLIDENGELIWTMFLGHVDQMVPGDIDPDNPGYEVAFGTEAPWQADMASVALVDLDEKYSGHFLWRHRGFDHLHTPGWAADVSDRHRGWEIMSLEQANLSDKEQLPYVHNCKGEVISTNWANYAGTIWWDDDDYTELIRYLPWDPSWAIGSFNGYIEEYVQSDKGTTRLGADLVGDSREDILFMQENGEMRIYSNTKLSHKKRPTPVQDRYYRLALSRTGTGYLRYVQLLNPLDYFSSVDYIEGDLNNDGQVDITDAQLAANVFLGIENDPLIIQRSDLDQDGDTDILDIQKIVNKILRG